MANKTILLSKLTAGTVGSLATESPIDVTEAVLGVRPVLRVEPLSTMLYSTIAVKVKEGKAKYLINRKVHVNHYNSTGAIVNDANSVGGAAIGAVTTSGYKKSKRDEFIFELNSSWDVGFIYSKKKDPSVREGEIIDDLASTLEDLREYKGYGYWKKINADVLATVGAKSIEFPVYVSSIDEKTMDAPELVKEISIKANPVTIEEKKLAAAAIIKSIFNAISEVSQIGRANSVHAGYPYARGTRGAIGQKIVMSEEMIEIISYDERYIQAAKSPQMIASKAMGMINNVEIYQDDFFETTSHFQIAVVSTGSYGAVIKGEELPDSIQKYDHPTKKTTTELLEGTGGFDFAMTPFINLCRFFMIKQTTTVSN